jgi:hypothetical protein
MRGIYFNNTELNHEFRFHKRQKKRNFQHDVTDHIPIHIRQVQLHIIKTEMRRILTYSNFIVITVFLSSSSLDFR